MGHLDGGVGDRIGGLQTGHDFARRVWDGPDNLPTMAEIRQPSLWLERIDRRDGRIPAAPSVIATG